MQGGGQDLRLADDALQGASGGWPERGGTAEGAGSTPATACMLVQGTSVTRAGPVVTPHGTV